MDTIGALFAAWIHPDSTRPVLTFYDDGTGDRTELSGATLANWVAKTANLLVDGCGLGPGDRVSVLLPPHWQTAAVLLGCWSAGVCVDLDGGRAEAAFATEDRLATSKAGDVFGLALAPFAAPMRPGPPAGVHDYVVEVRGHGDRFTPPVPVQSGDFATPDVTHSDLYRRAVQRAVPGGARVLIDGDATTDPVDWLLAPMAANASIVLCRHLDRAALPDRVATEHVTLVS